MYSGIRIFSGNANEPLGERIAQHLGRRLDGASVSKFSDGEINVDISENVRGRDVFLVQSTCAPANDHLMELLILCDACKRASAGRITAVVPLVSGAGWVGEWAAISSALSRGRGE